MCGRGGNCDGSCEATAVHQHVCPVCGQSFDCTAFDCDNEGAFLCDTHTDRIACQNCGEWVESRFMDGGICGLCYVSLLPFDEAHPERPRGI